MTYAEQPGRICPASFGYRPADLDREPEWDADVLLVAGGLYGNPEALDAVLELADRESAAGRRVRLVFNGDFHWFDADPELLPGLQAAVLGHTAIAGNVEAELADPSGAGCGCGYPDYVDGATVERSNAIMARLHQAAGAPERAALAALPLHRTVSVGSRRVAILHGDRPRGLEPGSGAHAAAGPGAAPASGLPGRSRHRRGDPALLVPGERRRGVRLCPHLPALRAGLRLRRGAPGGDQQRRRGHAQLPRRPPRTGEPHRRGAAGAGLRPLRTGACRAALSRPAGGLRPRGLVAAFPPLVAAGLAGPRVLRRAHHRRPCP